MARPCLRDAVELLLKHMEVGDYKFKRLRSNHWRVTYTAGGVNCLYHFASTPSDGRTEANTLAGIKRQTRTCRGE